MLSELCVRRPVFATMLVMSLVVLGIFSFRDLGVDLFPRADPATVNVRLSLPGASPDEISSSVIEPMEEAISGVAGIDEISARISEGGGNITVRFVLERDLNDAVNDVREKVAGAIKSVPPELLPPVITKVDPDAAPVMSIMVSSDAMSLRTLTELADKQISRSIQTANGVGQVTIAGTRSREIHIVVDIEKLNSYGLSLTQVRDAIVAAIVVMFFIRNIRAVIIAALAIPASIISSFTLMSIMGFTLNNMTLLGITLAVGIVIDDAIVVLENIFRYIEEKDCAPFDAAIQGTREVALAVMATTLSLVVIFLPIAFM